MKRSFIGACILFSAFMSGCVYDAGYNAYSGMNETGYQQQSYGDQVWGVAFVGGYPDFCKEAAFYRAAELTWEKGYHYFKILAKEDRSTNEATQGHRSLLMNGEMVGGGSVFVPVYYYKIKFLRKKPSDGKYVDAYHVLNTHNFPRKNQPYTVAERTQDKGTGNK